MIEKHYVENWKLHLDHEGIYNQNGELICEVHPCTLDENKVNEMVRRVNEHDALVGEVEAYKEKEKICTSCEQHPSWQIRAEKAEAEVELLRKNWISLARQILAEHDRDGWCRLVVPKESAQNMLNVLEEKDGEG